MLTADAATSPAPTPDDRPLALALAAMGAAVSIAFALQNAEGIVQFDDLTHYLFARWAWTWPAYLLDEWGRPGITVLYYLPAGIGWGACRVLSAFLSAGAAWAAYEIARTIGLRRAWLVVPLTFLQPLFFQLSQTTLTETPLALYLALAVLLALKGRWMASAAMLSPAFVTRHEAVLFLPIWIFFAWRSRVPLWRWWPILWAPLAVNLLAPLAGLRAPIERLFAPTPSTQYGRGGWLTFFCRSLEAWGPGITVLALTGLLATARRRGGAIVVACAVTYFGAQTSIRALGLYDSGGYARFLIPISPLVAVVALAGWHEICSIDPTRRRRAAMIAGASMVLLWLAMERQLVLSATQMALAAELPDIYHAVLAVRIATGVVFLLAVMIAAFDIATRRFLPAVIVGMILMATYALCHPLQRPPEADQIDEARAWLTAHGLGDRRVISANVWVNYAMGDKLPPDHPTVRKQIEQAPPGVLFAWERQFAASADHQLSLAEFQSSPSFRLLHQTPPARGQSEPYLTIFEKIGPMNRRD